MAGVAQNTHQDFWRPPISAEQQERQAMMDVCEGCGTEFMSGAGFCHVCGSARRPVEGSEQWSRFLDFTYVRKTLGLETASLVAFLCGMFCVLFGVVGVALVYSVQTLAEFQAVQIYRVEWLLGALVAFVAGILLKKSAASK